MCPNNFDRYAIWIPTCSVSGVTCICKNHLQSTGTIFRSVWIKFGKSMLHRRTAICNLLACRKIWFMHVCTRRKNKILLFIQKYFNIFHSIKSTITHWRSFSSCKPDCIRHACFIRKIFLLEEPAPTCTKRNTVMWGSHIPRGSPNLVGWHCNASRVQLVFI